MTLVEALNDWAARIDGDSQAWRLLTNAADQLAAVPKMKEQISKMEAELEELRELRHVMPYASSRSRREGTDMTVQLPVGEEAKAANELAKIITQAIDNWCERYPKYAKKGRHFGGLVGATIGYVMRQTGGDPERAGAFVHELVNLTMRGFREGGHA